MAVKNSFRGGWLLRFHLLLRLAGLTGLLVAAVGLALVAAGADWNTVESLRTTFSQRIVALIREPGEDAALMLARFLLPIGLAVAVLALIVEIWVALRTVAGRRSAFGTNVFLQVALALVLLVGVNVYAYLHYVRFDLTRDRQFTLPAELQQRLRELKSDSPTTIVVYQRHKTFGALSDKPDVYDYAAERKVVEKVRDLSDQFREFGPQFRVEVLDIEAMDYNDKLDQLTKDLAEEAFKEESAKQGRDEFVEAKAKEFRQ